MTGWMKGTHFIWGQNNPNLWDRACEIPVEQKIARTPPKGPVYSVELSTDGHLTLQGGILAATFINCLLVEPHSQGYTQDLNCKIEKALRERGLLKAQT